jgi:hypothetical protein
MHNHLEKWIAEWRRTMMAESRVGRETIDELESHLRENVDQLVRSGIAEPEAFRRAVIQLGNPPAIASEFQKLERSTWWPATVIPVIGVMAALALAMLLFSRIQAGRSSLLLASHVFLVTLGYATTFLAGALGVCFVGQRCLWDLSPVQLRSLTRVTFILGCAAAGLTMIGVVLGMIWAKAEWGRYWAWDVKEIGGFTVIVWQAGFLFAHRTGVTARGVVVLSLLGNIVVSLAWFGANLLDGLHRYGTASHGWLLLIAVISNLAVFIAGLAPAGWLRLRKEARPAAIDG